MILSAHLGIGIGPTLETKSPRGHTSQENLRFRILSARLGCYHFMHFPDIPGQKGMDRHPKNLHCRFTVGMVLAMYNHLPP